METLMKSTSNLSVSDQSVSCLEGTVRQIRPLMQRHSQQSSSAMLQKLLPSKLGAHCPVWSSGRLVIPSIHPLEQPAAHCPVQCQHVPDLRHMCSSHLVCMDGHSSLPGLPVASERNSLSSSWTLRRSGSHQVTHTHTPPSQQQLPQNRTGQPISIPA